MRVDLAVQGQYDKNLKDLITALNAELNGNPFTSGKFKAFEVELEGATANFEVRHGLGFIPKDIIQTSATGSGSVTWNYTLFTKEVVVLSVSNAVKVRFLAGSLEI